MAENMPKAYESALAEEKWYSFWEENNLFHGEPVPGKKPYSIVIPPPNVTGILTQKIFLYMLHRANQSLLFVFKCCLADTVNTLIGIDLYEHPIRAKAIDSKSFNICNFHDNFISS